MDNENGRILLMKNCHKKFPGVVAVNDVSFSVKRGQIHSLVGENGAGKSTLMKLLAGIYHLDSGQIWINGNLVNIKSPIDAFNNGISMIHQELDLIPNMTIEQNIFAGREKTSLLGIVKKSSQKKEAQMILDNMQIDINVTHKIKDLSVAQMQMVAIAKATTFNAKIIIMDEPTSAITDKEVKLLFNIIKQLKEQNKTIIYISHKLEEVFKISDHITVLRDGCLIDSIEANKTTSKELIKLMVGRDLKNMYVKTTQETVNFDKKEKTLQVEGLTRNGEYNDINLYVRRGEVLGISGLMGAGRTEIAETIFGIRKADLGRIRISGKKIKIKSPRDAINGGIAFISEDRAKYGLNLIGSVKTNITMAYINLFCKWKFLLSFNKEKNYVDNVVKQLGIRTTSREMIVKNLSGGNQQKVIIAKWLIGNPDIFIMDEPTRGIDVGAKAEIYQIIDDLAKRGKSVIIISSEMPELLGISDRIITLCNGRITGEFFRKDFSQDRIMACSLAGEV